MRAFYRYKKKHYKRSRPHYYGSQTFQLVARLIFSPLKVIKAKFVW